MEDKQKIVLERINKEIEKIDKKENNIYFFVIDTKGNPSGSLEYIYNLALILKNEGYKVTMLYQEDEFVGVGEWLGEEYASLPHEDISSGEISVSPSDVLFIPELFSNVMIQTKSLPCKRIVILQNYNYVLEQTTVAAQWGDYGIIECMTNTDLNAELIKDVFPYVKTTTIQPYINDMFVNTPNTDKKMVVNILCKDQSDINKIIKPFYWKYPMYKWVSFRDLRGFPKKDYANILQEGAITIWVDDDTNFGYNALEAMKCGSIVIAKVPNEAIEWTISEEEDKDLKNCCVWFNSYHDVHKILASVVRGWVTNNVPQELFDEANKTVSKYTFDKTKKDFLEYIEKVIETRKNEIKEVELQVKSEGEKSDE